MELESYLDEMVKSMEKSPKVMLTWSKMSSSRDATMINEEDGIIVE